MYVCHTFDPMDLQDQTVCPKMIFTYNFTLPKNFTHGSPVAIVEYQVQALETNIFRFHVSFRGKLMNKETTHVITLNRMLLLNP